MKETPQDESSRHAEGRGRHGGGGCKCGRPEFPSAAQPSRKLKIVVTGGHPGDPEYGCGGTIARLTALGHEVVLLYMNDGAWQEIPASVRITEAKKACAILKARPAYARQINGHAIIDNPHYEGFQKILEAENLSGFPSGG